MRERKYLLPAVAVLFGLVFGAKLLFIQVLDSTYQQAAKSNSTQRIKERAHRGHIRDRNEELLVYNVPVYDIQVTPKEVKAFDTASFSRLFGIEQDVLRSRLLAAKSYSYLKPSYVLGPMSGEEFAAVQGRIRDFEGFHVRVRSLRDYRSPSLAHALGYVAEVNKNQLKADTSNYYSIGDLRGISGLEAYYEKNLRGSSGIRYEMIDARGRTLGAFAGGKYDTLSRPGQTIDLGIDINLQLYAEQLMRGKTGSVVAIEPRTGEILCFVSAPSYAPQLLSGRHFTRNYAALQSDQQRPLFNRSLQAMYRPGSIFKVAQALVALQEGTIRVESVFPCDQQIIKCHPHAPRENLLGAIKNSCNPYFFRVMQRFIEPDRRSASPYQQAREQLQIWTKYMHDLGFGVKLPIDIPFSQKGFVPNTSYYDKIYGPLRWKYSNIYSLSIGEGENLVIPIQMANFVSIIANRGYYYIPHFARIPTQEATEEESIYQQRHKVPIDAAYFDVIQEAMQLVVEQGTGQRARISGIDVCGKTGSVQNKNNPEHSVFIAFAPREEPRIALSVYVEHGGEGGTIAAAIAGLLIEKYLKGESAALRMDPYVASFKQTLDVR